MSKMNKVGTKIIIKEYSKMASLIIKNRICDKISKI